MFIEIGDTLEITKRLSTESIDCCITSPPYFGLRDYEVDYQIGNEENPNQYIENLTCVFNEVKRVLKKTGTLWLNIGDSYTQSGKGYDYDPKRTPRMRTTKVNSGKHWGLGGKQLLGIPWRLAFSLQNNGWILRQDIIWHKPNPMPEPVKDRCTKAHEYIFLFVKNKKYYYNYESMLEPAAYAGQTRGGSKKRYEQNNGNLNQKNYSVRNTRDVWTIQPDVSRNKIHFATFPKELVRRCIVAGCPNGGMVLDPFVGSGTTLIVAKKLGMNGIGIEINPQYAHYARKQIETNDLF
jgi:DNA modification methylase